MKSLLLKAATLIAFSSVLAPASASVPRRKKPCGSPKPTNNNGTTTALPTSTHTRTSRHTHTPTPTYSHPCAIARDAFTSQLSASPGATPTMGAAVAYECLKSVPVHKEPAIRLLDALKPFLEWQSDLDFLKNPPPDYPYAPVDIFGELERIRSNLEGGRYAGELEWQEDLYANIVGKPHNGHLSYSPDLLTVPSEWARPWSLVSVSEDGTSLPVIKVLEDAVSPTMKSSHVVKINGVDADTYIEERVTTSSNSQDPDAGYNSMFFSLAQKTGDFEGGGREKYYYPGNTTTLTFANGTTIEKPNIAVFHFGPYDWTNVKDAETMHREFCRAAYDTTGSTGASRRSMKSVQRTTASGSIYSLPEPHAAFSVRQEETGRIEGYPAPVVITDDNQVSGYFLSEPGFEDVAVLALLSFDSDFVTFQGAVQSFLEKAVAVGKTKLVVDLQANGGGTILQGYDTFRQLFPDIVQDGPSRWRRSSTFDALSQTLSPICANYTPKGDEFQELDQPCNTVNNWRADLNDTGARFASYEDKFGSPGDEFTDMMQWDPSNPAITRLAFGTDITGYGARGTQNFTTRPFGGAENVVLLYDGYCASTCTIFSQFMRHDAGVKSVAMGGRKRPGRIQGVGGVKGAQVYPFSLLSGMRDVARTYTEDETLVRQLDKLDDTYVRGRGPHPEGVVNVRDAFLRSELQEGREVPTQFVTELADCRLFWTEPMLEDAAEIWKAAATAAFKGGKCVAGGIEMKPSISAVGEAQSYKTNPLPVRSGKTLLSDSLLMQYLKVKVTH
ncbi:hypothetical protein F5Y17DRAFT_417177 [Xylariaceae sp. FL0594]|nr:hypothetical protein F5Y17DRAFT_417177 [Xylariaceae sp. FL0594]